VVAAVDDTARSQPVQDYDDECHGVATVGGEFVDIPVMADLTAATVSAMESLNQPIADLYNVYA